MSWYDWVLAKTKYQRRRILNICEDNDKLSVFGVGIKTHLPGFYQTAINGKMLRYLNP